MPTKQKETHPLLAFLRGDNLPVDNKELKSVQPTTLTDISITAGATRGTVEGYSYPKQQDEGLKTYYDAPIETLAPLFTAIAFTPTAAARPAFLGQEQIEEHYVTLSSRNIRLERDNAARILIEKNLLPGIDQATADQITTMINQFPDDREGALDLGCESNFAVVDMADRSMGVGADREDSRLITSLVSMMPKDKDYQRQDLPILERLPENPSVFTLTQSGWNLLLARATTRHLDDQATIVVPAALRMITTEGNKAVVGEGIRFKVADLKVLTDKIFKSVFDSNAFNTTGFSFYPRELFQLLSQVDPYADNGISTLRPEPNFPQIGRWGKDLEGEIKPLYSPKQTWQRATPQPNPVKPAPEQPQAQVKREPSAAKAPVTPAKPIPPPSQQTERKVEAPKFEAPKLAVPTKPVEQPKPAEPSKPPEKPKETLSPQPPITPKSEVRPVQPPVAPRPPEKELSTLETLIQKVRRDGFLEVDQSSAPTIITSLLAELPQLKGLELTLKFDSGVWHIFSKNPATKTIANLDLSGSDSGFNLKAIKMENVADIPKIPFFSQADVFNKFANPQDILNGFNKAFIKNDIPLKITNLVVDEQGNIRIEGRA